MSAIPARRARCRLRRALAWAVLGASAALAGCAVGPRYVPPQMASAPAFKEAPPGSWKEAQPSDDLPRGPWWQAFADPELDRLARRALDANQDIAAAYARLRQARALVDEARAGWSPTVDGSVGATRSRRSGQTSKSYQLGIDARWEIDLWGRVGHAVAAQRAAYEASAADVESARLSVVATLAQQYFALRTAESERRLLADTVAAYARSLELTLNRQRAGVADKADVVQAEVQLKSAQAQLIDLDAERAQREHAIAVLVGELPAHFSLDSAPLGARLPVIPTGLASALLERRPDVAAAERAVAAANARIGLAQTAYFPAISLSADGGFAAARAAEWLTAPSRFWSIGLGLAQTLFDGGARRARSEEARAAYEAELAAYRQTVLQAFQEVEDGLATLRVLEEEARLQDETVAAAREALRLVTNQYKAGVVGYLNVIAAQATALGNERAAVALRGRRLAASVDLLRALGGGWERAYPQQAGVGLRAVP